MSYLALVIYQLSLNCRPVLNKILLLAAKPILSLWETNCETLTKNVNHQNIQDVVTYVEILNYGARA